MSMAQKEKKHTDVICYMTRCRHNWHRLCKGREIIIGYDMLCSAYESKKK